MSDYLVLRRCLSFRVKHDPDFKSNDFNNMIYTSTKAAFDKLDPQDKAIITGLTKELAKSKAKLGFLSSLEVLSILGAVYEGDYPNE